MAISLTSEESADLDFVCALGMNAGVEPGAHREMVRLRLADVCARIEKAECNLERKGYMICGAAEVCSTLAAQLEADAVRLYNELCAKRRSLVGPQACASLLLPSSPTHPNALSPSSSDTSAGSTSSGTSAVSTPTASGGLSDSLDGLRLEIPRVPFPKKEPAGGRTELQPESETGVFVSDLFLEEFRKEEARARARDGEDRVPLVVSSMSEIASSPPEVDAALGVEWDNLGVDLSYEPVDEPRAPSAPPTPAALAAHAKGEPENSDDESSPLFLRSSPRSGRRADSSYPSILGLTPETQSKRRKVRRMVDSHELALPHETPRQNAEAYLLAVMRYRLPPQKLIIEEIFGYRKTRPGVDTTTPPASPILSSRANLGPDARLESHLESHSGNQSGNQAETRAGGKPPEKVFDSSFERFLSDASGPLMRTEKQVLDDELEIEMKQSPAPSPAVEGIPDLDGLSLPNLNLDVGIDLLSDVDLEPLEFPGDRRKKAARFFHVLREASEGHARVQQHEPFGPIYYVALATSSSPSDQLMPSRSS